MPSRLEILNLFALPQRLIALLWMVALALIGPGAIAAQPKVDLRAGLAAVVQTPEVRAELVAYAPQGIAPGAPLELGLLLQHQAGWHTYWKNPGDSGLPTELRWTLPANLQASPVHWPTPEKIKIGRLANFGYENTVLLPVAITVPSGYRPEPGDSDLAIHLSASWLVCRTECIPQEGEFDLRLPLKGSIAIHRDLFESARAARPVPLSGTVQARIEGDRLLVQAQGLPRPWQGKALALFPEVPDVFVTTAIASPTDRVQTRAADAAASNGAPELGTQTWQGGVWRAQLPLSPLRDTAPSQIAFVFAQDGQSVRAVAEISGSWPEKAAAPVTSTGFSEATLPPSVPSESADTGGLGWALAAAFVGGLILNLMPCVFPVLAIKMLGFARHAGTGGVSGRVIGVAYTVGVVLSMAALGGVLLALRAGGEQLGWGFQLQSPAVVSALAVLFTLIGLNLLGLLEWGTLVPSGLAGLQLRHPAADAALSGVLAVAVASPCTAPFMGASLGLALTLPSFQAMGIFIALGLGLALPFAVVSSLPHLTRWMPKPGPWMLYLRQFMAFPMAATVLWLLWVLGHMGGMDAAASLAVLLWCLALTVWALNLQGRSRWVFGALALVVLLAMVRALGPNVLKTKMGALAEQGTERPVEATGQVQERWQGWSVERVKNELGNGRPVFVDFTAAWCITCQYNKQTTLSDPAVLQDFASKSVTLLRADWTQRDPAITGALAELGRSGVPVYVLYAPGKPAIVLSEILSTADLRARLKAL
ncbi:MAG: protein-disulfide reductase DsbD family protein [Rhodoferax sp.]|nr:protein-disulfide reductase DsbD family protein [Rhodoferax sp.]